MEERDQLTEWLKQAAGIPEEKAVQTSMQRVKDWFAATAPTIVWDAFESPIGMMYLASTERGICHISFKIPEAQFLAQLDPMARIQHNPAALSKEVDELLRYFDNPALRFDIPVDLTDVTDFQREALQLIRNIPTGRMWTYKDVAEKLGNPKASRAIGQAMKNNPVPIVIPCHRVVGSSGALTGYAGGGGIATKRYLLELEGAL